MDVAWTIILTLSGIFAVGVTAGFAVLFRRGRREGAQLHASRSGAPIAAADPSGSAALRAHGLLVLADDAVRDAADELDFAVAQFGEARTRRLQSVLASARARVMQAFELQQRLDDRIPDSEAQRRDWTARIIHLCESAQADLATELREFESLRERERNSPETLAQLRHTIEQTAARIEPAVALLAKLQQAYSAPAVESVADSIERSRDALRRALDAGDAAEASLRGASSTDAAAALDTLREGEDHARRAAHLLDAIDSLHGLLAEADAALATRINHTRDSIVEARTLSATATDAKASALVIDALSSAEGTLARLDTRNPVTALEQLREAHDRLDIAMSGSRNQEKRLAQAREALAGALVGARSQVSATRDYIEGRRGGIGREARTRLAEAERLLVVAEAESDPVQALDTARSAATYARDADALARYDLQH